MALDDAESAAQIGPVTLEDVVQCLDPGSTLVVMRDREGRWTIVHHDTVTGICTTTHGATFMEAWNSEQV